MSNNLYLVGRDKIPPMPSDEDSDLDERHDQNEKSNSIQPLQPLLENANITTLTTHVDDITYS